MKNLRMKNLRITLAFFAVLTLNNLFAQDEDVDVRFKISVVDYVTSAKIAGAHVDVLDEKSRSVATYNTDSLGRSEFILKPKSTYKIIVSATNKVERFFIFEYEKQLKNFGSAVGGAYCQVRLFDFKEGTDYSYVLTNPFTRFYLNKTQIEFDYDVKLAEKMAKKIEEIMIAKTNTESK